MLIGKAPRNRSTSPLTPQWNASIWCTFIYALRHNKMKVKLKTQTPYESLGTSSLRASAWPFFVSELYKSIWNRHTTRSVGTCWWHIPICSVLSMGYGILDEKISLYYRYKMVALINGKIMARRFSFFKIKENVKKETVQGRQDFTRKYTREAYTKVY